MPVIMKESKQIPVGRLTGTIKNVEVAPSTDKKTGKTYNYMNFEALCEPSAEWDGVIKFGINANLSKSSDLGRLLIRLGKALPKVDEAFDEQSLVGEVIAFDTVKDGYFTRVVTDSILPA